MENLVHQVKEKLKNAAHYSDDSYGFESLSREEKEALQEAERLADLYDIKPEPYVISDNYLFKPPLLQNKKAI